MTAIHTKITPRGVAEKKLLMWLAAAPAMTAGNAPRLLTAGIVLVVGCGPESFIGDELSLTEGDDVTAVERKRRI